MRGLALFSLICVAAVAAQQVAAAVHNPLSMARIPIKRSCRAPPPPGALIVSKTPSNGQYGSVQAAIDALSTTASGQQTIFIQAGVYKERVQIKARKARLSIYGSTSNPGSYLANQVTITHSAGQAEGLSNDQTATMIVYAEMFSLHNVNIVNEYGTKSQAVALSAQATKQAYYGCQIRSYQNTLLAQLGSQLYAGCYIEGAVDAVFGELVKAFMHRCTFGVLEVKQGWMLAPGSKKDEQQPGSAWLVVNRGIFQPVHGHNVNPQSIFLARPWGNVDPKVTVQLTYLGNVIRPEGFDAWLKQDPHTSSAEFVEFANYGPSSKGQRASFSKTASKEITMSQVLGQDFQSWVNFPALVGKGAGFCGSST